MQCYTRGFPLSACGKREVPVGILLGRNSHVLGGFICHENACFVLYGAFAALLLLLYPLLLLH